MKLARQSNGKFKTLRNVDIYTIIHGDKVSLEKGEVLVNWQLGKDTGVSGKAREVKLVDGEWWMI